MKRVFVVGDKCLLQYNCLGEVTARWETVLFKLFTHLINALFIPERLNSGVSYARFLLLLII